MQGMLAGKVALVTGASSGIGEATAVALAAQGAYVSIVARRADRLYKVASRISAGDELVLPIVADVTDAAQAKNAVVHTAEHWGHLDILVNNAGITLIGPVDSLPVEDWQGMVNLNILGVLYCTHAALPIMRLQGNGHIVNISSLAGRQVNQDTAVYSATKFAVEAFSEGLRQQVCKDKIRVTTIEPGAVSTESIEHITNTELRQQVREKYNSMRTLDSEDIAASIVFALTQPEHVSVNEILIRPTDEP